MPPDIPAEVDAERRHIVAELGRMGFALPGSIATRTVACGRATCRCASDPDQRHGPYTQWSRTIKGRTVNKMLSPQQLDDYQHWIDNGRRLRQLAHELETLSLEPMRIAEGWNSQTGSRALREGRKPRPGTRRRAVVLAGMDVEVARQPSSALDRAARGLTRLLGDLGALAG